MFLKIQKVSAARIAVAVLAVASLFQTVPAYSFPPVKQHGKTAVVCHRGWWKCEAGGMSENSLASLKAAQDAGFWGSECDVHLTKDGQVIVNHNPDIDGKKINTHDFADFKNDLLPNGEGRPAFDEYLAQTLKCKSTMLVVELKKQSDKATEDLLLDKVVESLKAHGLFKPKKVLFISFSRHISKRIAELYPRFVNQFLTSKDTPAMAPDKIAADGINGIDYEYKLFHAHPEWVEQAHSLGMSVNVWTVNDADKIQEMIDLGVDAITTNEPGRVRELLGENEWTY